MIRAIPVHLLPLYACVTCTEQLYLFIYLFIYLFVYLLIYLDFLTAVAVTRTTVKNPNIIGYSLE